MTPQDPKTITLKDYKDMKPEKRARWFLDLIGHPITPETIEATMFEVPVIDSKEKKGSIPDESKTAIVRKTEEVLEYVSTTIEDPFLIHLALVEIQNADRMIQKLKELPDQSRRVEKATRKADRLKTIASDIQKEILEWDGWGDAADPITLETIEAFTETLVVVADELRHSERKRVEMGFAERPNKADQLWPLLFLLSIISQTRRAAKRIIKHVFNETRKESKNAVYKLAWAQKRMPTSTTSPAEPNAQAWAYFYERYALKTKLSDCYKWPEQTTPKPKKKSRKSRTKPY
ncbi:MAG: hypothetical protein AB7E49_10700 [Campylobacterales bacterium]